VSILNGSGDGTACEEMDPRVRGGIRAQEDGTAGKRREPGTAYVRRLSSQAEATELCKPIALRGYPATVAYTEAEARQQLLDDLAAPIDKLALALALLGMAYEQLDERTSERLEESLFRPVQLAYGRLQRTHGAFADRSGIERRVFSSASPGAPSQTSGQLLETAADLIGQSDDAIGVLQDSMLPVEVGDVELRRGLADARLMLDGLPTKAHELVRVIGR
jgi:hypothetical protein